MVKICENLIENVKIELFSNGKRYDKQLVKLTNVNTGEVIERNCVAPSDFYIITTGILSEEYLCEFTNYIWTAESSPDIEEMIDELCNNEAGDY